MINLGIVKGNRRGAAAAESCHSTDVLEAEWDSFLKRNDFGELRQTSLWARMKQSGGWHRCLRAYRREGRIVGGFQLLWRDTRFGRIGYVVKGPLAESEEPRLLGELISLLKETSRQLRLSAIIVQPPALSKHTETALKQSGFLPNDLLAIISATVLVDVSSGIEAIEGNMRKTTRKHLRRAIRNGVRIREGSENDLDLFYSLMLMTCRRQGVRPNIANPEIIKTLWRDQRKGIICRLTFAEKDDNTLGALLCIGFGHRLELWKQGFSPEAIKAYPMGLLYYDAFTWAHAQGFQICDLGGINRSLAEHVIAGKPLEERHQRNRNFFKLGFGGIPILLPKAWLCFRNPLISLFYRAFRSFEPGQRLLRHAASKISDSQ